MEIKHLPIREGGKGKDMDRNEHDMIHEFIADELNGLVRERLVYTNPDPTKEFLAKNLQIDLKKSESIKVEFRMSIVNTFTFMKEIRKGVDGLLQTMYTANQPSLYYSTRKVKFDDTGISIDTAYNKNVISTGAGTATGTVVVPTRIWSLEKLGGALRNLIFSNHADLLQRRCVAC